MSNDKSPLSATDAVALLDLLTTDSDFRLTFQANPALALQRISPEAAASALGCAMPDKLVSIEALTAAREQLTQHLTGKAIFSVPFCFVEHEKSSGPDRCQAISASMRAAA